MPPQASRPSFRVPSSASPCTAAAPAASVEFVFWGAGVFVLPLTLSYTAAVYYSFRGRVADIDP